ncbi:MAG: RNA 2',3'-cyclic phosphodiesterase [Acidimicrobiia bacterium]
MTALRRAFLAAVPPPPVLDAIEELVTGATRRGFKWTRRDQWHVTIQYFGRVEDSDALVGALAGAVARVPAPTVQIRGAGGFPSAKRASVYWLGVVDPAPLAAVHDAVMAEAGGFVRPRDVVNFRPHVTLARLPSPKKLTEEVEALAPVSFGPAFVVDELVLMESETRSTGAVYHPVARLPLG